MGVLVTRSSVVVDTTPNAFTFTDQTDVATSSTITSAAITVSGINSPATITVTGGTYDINASGSFTSSSGTVNNGDTVRARHTSSGSGSTATNTVVTIGGVSDTFTSTTAAGGAASYTPFLMRDFGTETGTVGNALTTSTGPTSSIHNWGEVGNVQYSSDITGPFGASKTAKVILTAADRSYAGWFNLTPAISRATLLSEGDMWIRVYHYFPSSFCAGYGGHGGDADGSGSTKWIRLNWSGGEHFTYQLGGFSDSGCAATSTSPRVTWVSPEGFPDMAEPWAWWFGAGGDMQDGPIIPRDEWVALQFHVHWGSTRAASYLRAWVNETYLGQPETPSGTVPTSGSLDAIVLGDYWNGGVRSTTAYYIGDIIVTREQPNTLDSGGRPYISPDHQVSDF